MQIRVTSVASGEVGETLGVITVGIENALSPLVGPMRFDGVSQFIVVIVAVDSDRLENDKFVRAHNKTGHYRHPITSERVPYISIALPFDPVVLESMTEEQVRQVVCSTLLCQLDQPGVRIPKAFDYERFASTLRTAIEIYARSSFN